MGNCIPKRSAKLKEEVDSLNTRPFFRQESQFSTYGQLSYNGCPWRKRLPDEEISLFRRFSSEVKETVLHNESWKPTETATAQDFELGAHATKQTHKNTRWSIEGVRVEPVYTQEFYEDHYDTINESEIKPILKTKKEALQNKVPLPSPRVFKRDLPSPQEIHPPEPVTINESTTDLSSISEQEAIGTCLEYSEMVKIFRPLIVQNLLVHDILPHLPFLENHDDIYTEMKIRSPKDAVVSLLNELERSKELGKWQTFIDVLNSCGYTYIVDNIRGYKLISHEYQREYIKKLTPKISKMIVTAELLPHLLAKDIISESDNENIQRECSNFGNIAASVKLLDRISRKHRYWYKLFIEALLEAGMEDVAADLQIPKLLESKRTKVTDVYGIEDDVQYSIPPCPSGDTLDNSKAPLKQEQSTGAKVDISMRKCVISDNSQEACYQTESCYEDKDQSSANTENGHILPLSPLTPKQEGSRIQLPIRTDEYNNSENQNYEMFEDNKEEYAMHVSAPLLPTNDSKDDNLLPTMFTTENEQALPLAYQVPKRKPTRKVPLPIWTNTDLEQFVYDLQYTGKRHTSVSRNNSEKGSYEMYEENRNEYAGNVLATPRHTDDLHTDDTKDTKTIGLLNSVDNAKYMKMYESIQEMKQEKQNILLEVGYLEKKSALHEDVNCGLRRRQKLLEEIEQKKNEKQALQSDDPFQDKEKLTDDDIDAYYPTRKNVHHENDHRIQTPVLSQWIIHTFDNRPLSEQRNLAFSRFLPLNEDSPLSTVQLYSPSFDSKGVISELFEQDSAIGCDIEIEADPVK